MYDLRLAPIKQEGVMYVSSETVEDGTPLPKMPPKFICNSVQVNGTLLSRKDYTSMRIRQQRFYK